MPTDFIVVIPARYASTRLPGKPLLPIGTETLLENVYHSAIKSNAKAVYIATDDDNIVAEANRFGGYAIFTDKNIRSGTDRLHAASIKLNLPADQIVVNLQGDEYNFNPDHINQVALALDNNKPASMATLCEEIVDQDDMKNENLVKVVMDDSGYALYFSRSPVPWSKDGKQVVPLGYKHIGIYAYRNEFLNTYVNLQVPEIERKEDLEQLRAMYYGYRIYVQQVSSGVGMEVNTKEDLEKARMLATKEA